MLEALTSRPWAGGGWEDAASNTRSREMGAGVLDSLVSREERSVGKSDVGGLKFPLFPTSPSFSGASSHLFIHRLKEFITAREALCWVLWCSCELSRQEFPALKQTVIPVGGSFLSSHLGDHVNHISPLLSRLCSPGSPPSLAAPSVFLPVYSSSPFLGVGGGGVSLSLLTSLMISSSLMALNTIHEPSVHKFTSPDQTSHELKEATMVIQLLHGELYQAFPTPFAKPGHFSP